MCTGYCLSLTSFFVCPAVIAAEAQPLLPVKRREDGLQKKPPVEIKNAVLEEDQKKATSARIWAMVLKQKGWFYLGLLGAFLAGAMFPIFAYLLASVTASFYDTSPHRLRRLSTEYSGTCIPWCVNT